MANACIDDFHTPQHWRLCLSMFDDDQCHQSFWHPAFHVSNVFIVFCFIGIVIIHCVSCLWFHLV
jgi:hypothetical protein